MSDLSSFKKAFKGDVITPEDPGYDQAINRWAVNAIRRACVVAFVKEPEDISLALKYAKAAGMAIAVRGGGHSVNGASSSEGGLVIDLSRYFRGVRIDPERRLAFVQGGATWEQVDKAAIEHGLATVGGTVNHTGVGGLATGGGYGWLSGEHGLTIDNMVQVTMVVANGEILVANATENPDLYFGVRGGGSNFGIVTEFVFKLHPQRRTVFAGPLLFSDNKVDEIAQVLAKWYAGASDKECVHAVMTQPPGAPPAVVVFLFFNGSAEEGQEKYKDLYNLGPLFDGAKEIPYEDVNTMFNDGSPSGQCYWVRGMLCKNPLEVLTSDNFKKLKQILSDYPQITTSLAIEYVPHRKINGVAADATPYRRDLPGNAIVLTSWKENEAANLALGMKIVTELEAIAKAPGTEYGNYSTDTEALPNIEGPGKANRAKDLFREHYPRLQRIKRKYDPEMVFNKWFTIEPAKA